MKIWFNENLKLMTMWKILNKFTAEYIFLMNQNDSSIPRVNSASKNRLEELNKEWIELKNRSEELIQNIIPAYNKILWNNEIGALNVK